MPQRFIAHICLLSSVLFAAVTAQAQQTKTNSDAGVSETLQAMEHDWLNAEKNHDAAAFEKIVADDWIAIGADGKSQPKAQTAPEIEAAHIPTPTIHDTNSQPS